LIRAQEKARLKGNALKNRTKRVLAEMGFDENAITIIDWAKEVETHALYKQKREQIQ
jgi:hypothetical protein